LVKKGESIGYGKSFIADKDTNIAIVPVGYADGLKRNLSNGVGKLYVQSKACPIVGNICMDMTMIDITGISVKEGAEVEIIGEHQSILDLANDAQTIPYEILTSIPLRVHRIYVEN
jgi:alanine racemase